MLRISNFFWQNKNKILICLPIVYVLFVFSPAFFNKGPLLQTDQPMWRAAVEVWKEEVIPNQKWFWGSRSDRIEAGLILGESYSLCLIFPWVLSFLFSIDLSIKLVTAFSCVYFCVSFFVLCKKLTGFFWAAFFSCAVLTPVFHYAVSGMWYNVFSLGTGILFWLLMERDFQSKECVSWGAGGVLWALAIYSHPTGAIFCGSIFMAYLYLHFSHGEKNKAYKMVLVFIVAILIAFPQIFSMIGYGVEEPTSDFSFEKSDPESIYNIFQYMFFLFYFDGFVGTNDSIELLKNIVLLSNNISVAFLFFLGVVFFFAKKHGSILFSLLSLLVFSVLLISRIYLIFGLDINFFATLSHFSKRFELFPKIYLMIFGAAGLQFMFLQAWKNLDSQKKLKVFLYRFLFFFVVLNVGTVIARIPFTIFYENSGVFVTLRKSRISNDIDRLWDWMNNNVLPEKERVFVEGTWGTLKWNNSRDLTSYFTHVLALSSIHTDISQIGAWNGFYSQFASDHVYGNGGYAFARRVQEGSGFEKYLTREAELLNCKYIISNSDILSDYLDKASSFDKIRSIGPFNIYEYLFFESGWGENLNRNSTVEVKRYSSSEYHVIANGKKGDTIVLSYAFHPAFKALQGDARLNVFSRKSLISFKLQNSGTQEIKLVFRPEKRIPLIFLSLGILLFIFSLKSKIKASK